MTGFNFLSGSGPSLAARVRELRISTSVRAPLLSLMSTVLLILATCAIESVRFAGAQALGRQAASRLFIAQESAVRMAPALSQVIRLEAIASGLDGVQRSGALRAREVAEIGDRLPANVWLRSFRQEQDFVLIAGGAQNFSALARAIAMLNTSKSVAAPALVSVRTADVDRPTSLNFELRLTGRPQ